MSNYYDVKIGDEVATVNLSPIISPVFLLISSLDGGGGSEHFTVDLSQSTNPDFYYQLVTIYSSTPHYTVSKPIISLDFHNSTTKKNIILRRVIFIIQCPWMISKYIRVSKNQKPLASLSIFEMDCIINMIVSLFTGIKPIIAIRYNPFITYQSFTTRISHRVILLLGKYLSHKIVTNSNDIREKIISIYNISPDKIVSIQNPKDIEAIRSLMKEPITESFFDTNTPIIINIARLDPLKGQEHLLRIFAGLRKKIECKLVFCGEDRKNSHYQEFLENLAYNLGIMDDVIFLGWCKNPYKYLARATVFAFPSLSEGLPNALIEALICGCPVVSADCDYGPREILSSGEYGVLCEKLYPLKSPKYDSMTSAECEMLDNIHQLITDSELREKYIRLGYVRAKDYSKDKIFSQYHNIVMEVVHSQ